MLCAQPPHPPTFCHPSIDADQSGTEIDEIDSPLGHCQGGSTLPLELTIHENPVLPIALQIELLLLKQDFHVRPRDEGGVAKVDVDVSLGAAVSPNHHPRLSHTVFELFALDLCDRTLAHVLRTSPVHHLLRGVLGPLLES